MKLFTTSILCIISLLSYADNPIVGNTSVIPGAVESYTVNWSNWSTAQANYSNVYWTVTNGTVLSSDKHNVTIQWDITPIWLNVQGTVQVVDDLGGATGDLVVTIVNFVEGTMKTCNGILGPPSVFVNFGTGPNPGPALPAGSITYQYSSSCIISSGKYARSNNTIGCNGNWLGLTEDHTSGDVNGYMLMVDGDDNPGEVYRTVASNLTAAFGYEFSVYVVNLANGFERPRLEFKILDMSDNLIQKSGIFYVDYDGSNPWKKLSFVFDLPPGITSVQVVLVNTNNDPYGNDFVVDDISFAPCYPPILASFSNSTIVDKSYTCNNGTVNLFSRWPTPTVPFTNPSFKWQKSSNNGTSWSDIPGATTLNFSQTESLGGIYQYRVYAFETSAPSQYVISNMITYFVQKMIVDAKTYSVYNCNPAPVQLIPNYRLQYSDVNGPSLSYGFVWSPSTYLSDPTIANPTISLPALPPPNNNAAPQPPVNRSYTLTIQNNNFGCVGSGVQTVSQFNPRKVFVPSAFSPNGDGSNDLFRPLNIQDYPGAKFWVYNRYGQVIFYSQGPTLLDYSWNGKFGNIPQGGGNYVWQVEIPGCPNNIDNGAGGNTPSGNVILIR